MGHCSNGTSSITPHKLLDSCTIVGQISRSWTPFGTYGDDLSWGWTSAPRNGPVGSNPPGGWCGYFPMEFSHHENLFFSQNSCAGKLFRSLRWNGETSKVAGHDKDSPHSTPRIYKCQVNASGVWHRNRFKNASMRYFFCTKSQRPTWMGRKLESMVGKWVVKLRK